MTKRASNHRVRVFFSIIATAIVIACSSASDTLLNPSAASAELRNGKAASGPTVTSANPAAAKRDTTLDVHVFGSGFSNGSRVDFLLSGVVDQRIHTNSTQYVSSSELVANITIDANAAVDYRDVAVTTATGKKGIGTESFVVLDGGTITVSGLTSLTVWDVNSSGIAVGYGAASTGCGNRGFAWSESMGSVLLPLPVGYCASNAYRISEGGLILGNVTKSPTSFELARWSPSGSGSWTVEVIGKPTMTSVFLTSHGVNDVGSLSSSWKNPDGSLDSWYWSSYANWKRLARPAGSTFCELEMMNSFDQMVGYCHTSTGNAVYWANPTAPATQLPSPPNGLAGNAYAISESGVIRGSSTIGGVGHTVLWIPDGIGGWSIQDLGTVAVADRNEQGSVVITSSARAQFIPAGGAVENLGVHLTGAQISDQSGDGTTWIVGYDDGAHPAQRQAFWFKR